MKPIGILYEHPEWFKPLFAELDRRGIPYAPIYANEHRFDPADRTVRYSLIVNRISPSAYLRGHGGSIQYARHLLAYYEGLGIPVVNGSHTLDLELSKAKQADLLERLGLPYPRTRVVNHPSQLVPAAAGLRFPVIVKPNIGGSGALMQRFDDDASLQAGIDAGAVDFGVDHTALIQEFLAPAGGKITRVEVLDGQVLYGIDVYVEAVGSFNLCPADICQTDGAPVPTEETLGYCLAPAPKAAARRVEKAEVPPAIAADVVRLVRVAGIDVGGVEYLVSAADGRIAFYDVNALSNFVADAVNVVGFDPFELFVDYLVRRATAGAEAGERTLASIR